MDYRIIQHGPSRSFPDGDPFLAAAGKGGALVLHLGDCRGVAIEADPDLAAVLIELGQECLGVHTGEEAGREGSNRLGFARYRNGDDAPSRLIELVRQPATSDSAIATARDLFEAAGFEVALCADQAGRIVDRLVRPKYNAALRFLDEGLASAEDMDLTCRQGLGYAEGPIERVVRGGLARHCDITEALFRVYGTAAYAPARRALVAKERSKAT